jgi:UrcA family protein
MRSHLHVSRAVRSALTGVALAVAASAAVAQPMEVVTVEAARSTTVGQTMHGVPVDEVTIRSRVSYADLDLTTASGALELENRIRATAESSCRKLDVKFPAEGSSEAVCIKNAVEAAMQEARKVIDTKRKTP